MTLRPQDFTRCVHAGVEPDKSTGAIMTPIYQTSTFVQKAPGEHQGWDYSRAGNPTRDALEAAYAGVEGARYGLAFSSGLAAEQAIMQTLDPGSKILVCDDVYGGTGRLFRQLLAKYQLEFEFIDMSDLENVRQAADEHTKLIWIETPTNPLMKIIDIAAVAEIAKSCKAKLVVDNTFASPVFQSPLELGADIVMHSTTKYIGGHSDLIGGAVMTSDEQFYESIKFVQFAAGAVPSPLDSFLFLRSLKTLAVRMRQHQENAFKVAEFLESESEVEAVFFPGFPSHPQHDLAMKQMRGFSGMISFRLKGDLARTTRFVQALEIFELAESLGGVESLVNHPELMTHASVPEPLRRKLGIGPNLLRLSVGIESADDLCADLKAAFDSIR